MAKEVIDPWGSSLPKDYKQLIEKFGLEKFNINDFPKPNLLMRRNKIICGRDLKLISKCIKEKKPFYVLTGIMPTSEKLHFGTKSVIDQVSYFQKMGATTYVLVADLEAAATRGTTPSEAKKRAIEIHIPCYIALGLDPKKTIFYFQSNNNIVTNLAFQLSNKATLNEYRAIYGNSEPSRIMASILQVSDILHPQLKHIIPGIIPVGLDQDPHIRLSRDIAKRAKEFKFFQPASINHAFLPDLSGDLKMSKSEGKPLYLLDSDEEIKKKINKALTGGQDTQEKQKKLGGNPNKDMVFELFTHHLIKDDNELEKRINDYKKGKIMDSENKKYAIKLMQEYMKDFNKDYLKAKKLVKQMFEA